MKSQERNFFVQIFHEVTDIIIPMGCRFDHQSHGEGRKE